MKDQKSNYMWKSSFGFRTKVWGFPFYFTEIDVCLKPASRGNQTNCTERHYMKDAEGNLSWKEKLMMQIQGNWSHTSSK